MAIVSEVPMVRRLRVVGHRDGMLSLEIEGHFGIELSDPAHFYHAEHDDLDRALRDAMDGLIAS